MKKVDFQELSNKRCNDCHNRLKQNLVNRRPSATLCYKCFKKDKSSDES
jgi:formate-dependent nitrite reductase cytochrome c552 subunit